MKDLYILWNSDNHLTFDSAAEVDVKDTATTERCAMEIMDEYKDNDVTLYKLVPVRKYERASGVKVTELKETKR